MKTTLQAIVLVAATALMVGIAACKKDPVAEDVTTTTPTATGRQEAIDDYNNVYLASATTGSLGWTGSTTTCTPGNISAAANDKIFQRQRTIKCFSVSIFIEKCKA